MASLSSPADREHGGVGIALLTGSIYTAMVWHMLNNGLALWLGSQGVEVADTGVVCGGLALWIIWRNRTPHPAVGAYGRNAYPAPSNRPGAG